MPPPPSLELIDCGVPVGACDAARHCFATLTSARRGPLRIALFDGATAADFDQVLAAPISAAVDITCLSAPQRLPVRPNTLVWRISTRTALAIDGSGTFARAIVGRHPQLAAIESKIAMALQEAIGNAVLHGNLDLRTARRGNLEGLAEFAAEMERRTALPAFAFRPVTVGCVACGDRLVIWVDDCGRGFIPVAPRDIVLSAGGGNGLAMIRACCSDLAIRRGGRRTVIAFGPRRS
jgi:hypothetical protein